MTVRLRQVTFGTDGDESVLLLASLSRVQHSVSNNNIALRILVDGSTAVAISNTGRADNMYYDQNAMHGAITDLSAGTYHDIIPHKGSRRCADLHAMSCRYAHRGATVQD